VRASLSPGLSGSPPNRGRPATGASTRRSLAGKRGAPVLPGLRDDGQQDRLDRFGGWAGALAVGSPRPERPAGRFSDFGARRVENGGRRRNERGPGQASGHAQPTTRPLHRRTCAPRARHAPSLIGRPAGGRSCPHRAMNPIANAFAMSMKKAETSGRMMKAWAQAPCSLVTAVILAIAVGVAPRLMPVKPAEITAA
jgi:hypothetical protein